MVQSEPLVVALLSLIAIFNIGWGFLIIRGMYGTVARPLYRAFIAMNCLLTAIFIIYSASQFNVVAQDVTPDPNPMVTVFRYLILVIIISTSLVKVYIWKYLAKYSHRESGKDIR